ncbi:MAG TPA: MBL fold metallo-hydrolase [Firmicutes bacterium]|nr:MBL fold metallo-hydrolase [Bacillota bacterium]
MLLEALEVGPFMANCYLVACPRTKEGLIIDPGGEGPVIIAKARKLALKVCCIINTHAHIDHVSANADVSEAFTIPVLGHKADLPLFHSRAASLALMSNQGKLKEPDSFLQEGDMLQLGQLRIRILETPGHSPGCICLEINGALFTGDTLFASSIGRTDLPGGSYREIIRSIKEKLLTYPDRTDVYPGHGPPTTIGEERRYNPFLT